jgi:hypothetical protein
MSPCSAGLQIENSWLIAQNNTLSLRSGTALRHCATSMSSELTALRKWGRREESREY